ncbi:maleylpyruvate isomerase N-terminal domain-containing protein [Phycicoccus sp. 3266]|uniref:maleylpyruvate isomerase N-terminal domain-containing protein n=1 Tax=Phycicoccus sp. 3266 TaxID=2817751 RepID=UPI00285C2CB6|nr:maleylpyruvate isomerase N-terminal domain-containing protein [Phycicoccus sp. 3266]MDR6863362.1 hypothetical protein [Phycicoccus sp. 3266]
MPLHPAAPEDLAGLVAAYEQTTQAVVDLGRSCRDEDFSRPTAREGWTVRDEIAHVVAGDPAHRAGVSAPKLVSELELVAERRVRGLTEDPDAVAALRRDTIAAWVAEQDIRQALGRPGDLDSPAAAIVMEELFGRLPELVAERAGIPPGNVVILEVTGPVLGRAGVWVDAGEDGQARGIPLFSGVAHDGDPQDVFTTITLSTDAVTRRCAGRGAVDEIHYTAHGDEDVARRVLENLTLTS